MAEKVRLTWKKLRTALRGDVDVDEHTLRKDKRKTYLCQ